jgi:hypothetical protein
LRELVPWAGREAVVAAVDAIAEQRAQRLVDRSLVLDRQIGDAPARVDPVRRREGVGRAGVEAGAALAAMVGFGIVIRQLGRQQQLAEEQPGAVVARHEVGVLALPTQPAACAAGFSISGAVSTNTLMSRR